jgi:putative redox protein
MADAVSGMVFDALTPSGHTLSLDTGVEFGGAASGPQPLELLLVSLGACTGMDVISIMRKKRQKVTHYRVNVYANRAKEHPKVYTEIVVEHVISGDDIDVKAVARSVELSMTKYCPVHALLSRAVPIEHVYRVSGPQSNSGREGA